MNYLAEIQAEYAREMAKTRQVLEAIPADADYGFKPHEKSMALGRLAGHVVESAGEWAAGSLGHDKIEFPPDHKFVPYVLENKQALLERFDRETAAASKILAEFADEKWEAKWQFIAQGKVWIEDTKYHVFRTWVLSHVIHHRAQLGVYLRILGVKLPGTYGPSADDM